MELKMPYVNRNSEGEVVELRESPFTPESEWLELDHIEVVRFLRRFEKENDLKKSLDNSDVEMARVVEDLVDMLMEKQVFVFTELPEAVQSKLNARKKLRRDVNDISNLIGEDDNIF